MLCWMQSLCLERFQEKCARLNAPKARKDKKLERIWGTWPNVLKPKHPQGLTLCHGLRLRLAHNRQHGFGGLRIAKERPSQLLAELNETKLHPIVEAV